MCLLYLEVSFLLQSPLVHFPVDLSSLPITPPLRARTVDDGGLGVAAGVAVGLGVAAGVVVDLVAA